MRGATAGILIAGVMGVDPALGQQELSANRLRLREQYTAFVQTLAPAGGARQGAGESVWEALERLGAAQSEIYKKHTPPPEEDEAEIDIENLSIDVIMAPLPHFPDVEEIYRPSDPRDEEDAARIAFRRELGLRYLNDCRDQGLFQQVDDALAMGWSVPPKYLEGDFLCLEDLWSLGAARTFARLDRARMHLALERGDLDEFTEAFDQIMRLGGLCARYPGLIARQVAMGIVWSGSDEVIHALNHHSLDAPTCERLQRSLELVLDWPVPSAMYQAYRFSVLDSTEHLAELYGYSPARRDLVSFFIGS